MAFTADTRPNNRMQIGTSGRVKLIAGVDAVQVFVKTRLATELGEWLYNNQIGVDWYGDDGIFRAALPSEEVSALVRFQILDVANVDRITSFNYQDRPDLDRNFKITASYVATSDSGTDSELGVDL